MPNATATLNKILIPELKWVAKTRAHPSERRSDDAPAELIIAEEGIAFPRPFHQQGALRHPHLAANVVGAGDASGHAHDSVFHPRTRSARRPSGEQLMVSSMRADQSTLALRDDTV